MEYYPRDSRTSYTALADVYESSAPSYAQVKFWVGEFKRGRTSSEDETRSGRPQDATDEEMCKKVRDLVYSDRRGKRAIGVRAIEEGLLYQQQGRFCCTYLPLEK